MSDYVHVNGQLMRYEEAGVAPADAGLMHGAGLFETMRVRGGAGGGRVFRLRQHLERLTRSAGVLSIPVALGETLLAEMVEDLLEANDLAGKDGGFGSTITRGDMHLATAEDPVPPVTLILSATEWVAYPATLYEQGMTVVISGAKQNPESPICGHKTTSYLDRLLALREVQAMKAGEALWFTVHDHFLAEGCISNVFVVSSAGVLLTPPLTMPGKANQRLCLPGVTRECVMELAGGMGMRVEEKLMTIEEVLGAKEIFVTNAVMGVMPVTRVEKHEVGGGKVGEVAAQLRSSYERSA